jgi:hypothetical protein
MVGGLGDERIARGRVNHVVKLHVGVDHWPDTRSSSSRTPCENERGVKLGMGQGGTAGSETVEYGTHLIHLRDRLCLERRHPQAAAPDIDDKAILLEQPQRLQDGLARDAECCGKFLLREPRARCQISIADGVQ